MPRYRTRRHIFAKRNIEDVGTAAESRTPMPSECLQSWPCFTIGFYVGKESDPTKEDSKGTAATCIEHSWKHFRKAFSRLADASTRAPAALAGRQHPEGFSSRIPACTSPSWAKQDCSSAKFSRWRSSLRRTRKDVDTRVVSRRRKLRREKSGSGSALV
jgi:hypothetical protein